MGSHEQEPQRLETFRFGLQEQRVNYVTSIDITEGVVCDAYAFEGDDTKDLGIIKIEPGCKTPLQRVVGGQMTFEGFVSGKGKLTITKPDSDKATFEVNSSRDELPHTLKIFSRLVSIGEIMQWEADADTPLVAYEICIPKYEDGRFENLPEA